MSGDILIFGGTFEGRIIAEALSRSGIRAHVFTATAYGGALIQNLPHLRVHSERLEALEMREFMEKHGITRVVDATHPYAREVTRNIVQAAHGANVEYIRVIRAEMPLSATKGPSLSCEQGPTCEPVLVCEPVLACEPGPACKGSLDTMNDSPGDRERPGDSEYSGDPKQAGTLKHVNRLDSVTGLRNEDGVESAEAFSRNGSRDNVSSGNVFGNHILGGNTANIHDTRQNALGQNLSREITADKITFDREDSFHPAVAGQDGRAPCAQSVTSWGQRSHSGIVTVADTAAAVSYLASTSGSVFVTTGSKELDVFCALPDFKERLYVRVLPMPEVVERCYALGLSGAHIIAMQGPFGYEVNAALLRHCGCRYLVTKNTGRAGGMEEKVAAALDCGVEVVIIERPVVESGLTLGEALAVLGLTENPAKQG